MIESQTISVDLESSPTCVTLRHLDKKFGEDGVWDTTDRQDCFIEIKDIKFDDVSVGPQISSSLLFRANWSDRQLIDHDLKFIEQYSNFHSNGLMSFNGDIDIEFELPIYNWLTVKKYKIPKVDAAYFSNYSLRWHYERDLELIKEIKELMNFD